MNYLKTIVILINLWSISICAQDPKITWELNEYLSSASKTYVARDQIKLTNNFRYVAVPGTAFSAKIDAGLLFPPTTNTYKDANGNITTDPTQGAVAGSISGQFAVSPTGAATYSIPIEVPAGINGMQPQVSIAYNSQAGFGALGIGWDITGGSAITRGGKSIYYDNQINSIKFDNSDALYLDGQRLILISGSPFVDAIYGTEVENFATIKYTGSGFVITTSDGKIMEYGIVPNSLVKNVENATDQRIMAWKLNKVTDTYNNSIVYSYSDCGQYLQKIEYAGQTVEFVYNQTMQVAKTSYISDFMVSQTKLLTDIKMSDNTLKFEYKSSSDNRLNAITLFASDNTKFKSNFINWGDESSGVETVQVAVIDNIDLIDQPQESVSIQYGDINGDGYPDRIDMWVGAPNQRGYFFVYLYNKNNPSNPYSAHVDIYFDYYDHFVYKPKYTVGDINNDGKAEIVFADKDNIKVYTYNGTSFSSPAISPLNMEYHIGYESNRNYQLLILNVNNDNFNDVIIVFNNYIDSHRKHYYPGYTILSGSQNGLSLLYDKSFPTDSFDKCLIGDFNSDGKLDVYGSKDETEDEQDLDENYISVKIDKKYNKDYDNLCEVVTSDFNGNGRTDLLAKLDYDLIYWELLSDDREYADYKYIGIHNVSNIFPRERYDKYTLDYNGDGLTDFILGDETFSSKDVFVETKWYFYKNIGGNFELEKTLIFPNRITGAKASVVDVNFDGIDDLVLPIGGNFKAFTMPSANRRNIVKSITNGMNLTNSFIYKNFSDYDQTVTTGNVRNLKAPILLVDTHTDPEGSVTNYTFEKPKIHTEGKGFLGFSTVTVVNTEKNVKSVSTYGLDSTYYSQVLLNQTVITVIGNDTISTTVYTDSTLTIDVAKKRYIPIVTKQVVTDQFKGVEQKTVTNYSQYPTTLTQTATIKNSVSGIVDLTTKVVTTLTGPNGVHPYLPATVTNTRMQGGKSDTTSTTYSYIYNTDPTKKYQIIKSTEITNPNKDAFKVITESSNPDAFGHMLNIAVKAKNQTGAEITRGGSVTYTASGRFTATKTDNMGVVTTYDWDETNGQLKSESTTIGGKTLTTNYTYNSRGDLIETRYPDGNRKTAVLQWAGADGVTGAVYKTYSQASGSAPLTVWYDALGREIQKDTYGLDTTKIIIVSTEYFTSGQNKGKIRRVSEPHFEGESFNWAATYSYNATYGYAEDVTTPVGTSHTAPNKLTTTVTTPEGSTVTVTNAAGQTLSNTVNGKKVSYEYYPNGLTKSSTPEGGLPITMKYNPQGKRTLLVDPDAGTIRTEYNGWGELTKEVQRVHLNGDSISTTNVYKPDGRIETINRNNEITTYTYDASIKSRVNVIEISGKNKQTFDFDEFNRVTKVTEYIISNSVTRTYISSKEYDALGRIKKEIFPSGYYTVNIYDRYSNLKETKDQYNRSIWKANTENALGQATSIFKGAKETTYEYDPINHQTTSIYANAVVNYTFGYNSKNNLSWRKDILTTQQEDFGYDELNRLISWKVTRNGNQTPFGITYDPANLANIKTKSGIETLDSLFTMYYGGKNPNGTTTGRPNGSLIGLHALSAISGVPASPFPQTDLNVSYTDFKKIKTLTEGNKYYELSYGVDDQRRMSVYKEGGVTKLTRYYVGNYEEEVLANGNIRKIHYLSGAILIQNNGVDSLLYTYSDAQGSLIALTDVNGGIVRKYAYDPWGARRKYDNWNVKDDCVGLIINCGYTGHEHLDAFGIINMSGRVYDPLTAMFFSPDPYVQAPGDWVNYNRYGYCYGNPFKYTDPTGNFIFSLFIPVVGVFLDAACWGAVLGGAGYTASVAISIGGFSNWNSSTFWKSVGIGALSGAVTFGVGQAFGAVGSVAKGTFDVGKEFARAGVHGFSQGGLSMLGGGDFMQGFTSGAFGSFGGSLFQGVGGSFANSMAGTIGFSALSGGVGSALSGGNFWQGVATGATVGLLNHSVHLARNVVEQQKNEIFLNKIEKVATALGLSAETTAQLKEYAIGMAKIGRGAEAIEKIGKIAKLVGRASGVVGAGVSIGKAYVNPTAPNVIAAIVNTALVGAGPITSIVSGVLDLTGVSERVYNFVGNDLPSKTFDVYYNLNQNLNNTLNSLMVTPY